MSYRIFCESQLLSVSSRKFRESLSEFQKKYYNINYANQLHLHTWNNRPQISSTTLLTCIYSFSKQSNLYYIIT
jgi:hypothetical protein